MEDAFSVTNNLPFHEAGLLKLNCDKALFHLKWEANLGYEECVDFVGGWYVNFYKNNIDMYEFTVNQIKIYEQLAKNRNLIWTN